MRKKKIKSVAQRIRETEERIAKRTLASKKLELRLEALKLRQKYTS